MLGVGQAVGRIDLTRFDIQTNAGAGNQVAIYPVFSRLKPWIIPAKALAVPQVDAGLILDLNVHVQILEQTLT